ncbi:hypothetical protein ACKLNR_006195 [Fusarium oxysporum f. sp. zingiberi]
MRAHNRDALVVLRNQEDCSVVTRRRKYSIAPLDRGVGSKRYDCGGTNRGPRIETLKSADRIIVHEHHITYDLDTAKSILEILDADDFSFGHSIYVERVLDLTLLLVVEEEIVQARCLFAKCLQHNPIIDCDTERPFACVGTIKERGLFKAQAGRVYNLEVRFNNHHPVPRQVIPMGRGAIELGGRPVTEAEEMLQEAERTAREADVAIVAVGLNQDWECEGYGRDSMKLPGKSDELVQREPPSSYHSSVISDVEIQPLKTTSSVANTPVAILSFMVQNVGKAEGRESVQIYVARPNGIGRFPEKELREFIKVELGAGEKKTYSVQLTMEAFAYFDTSANKWKVDAGDYKVLPGSSSRDIKESVDMFIETKASWLEYPKLK